MPALSGRRVVMIIAHRDFRDEEYQKPRAVFENEGAQVTVASTETTPAKGMFGASAKPDITLDRVSVDDYAAVVFVGGSGSAALIENAHAQAIAKAAAGKGKVVAAICIAPSILAAAGVLKGKKATVWSGDAKFPGILKKGGASFLAQDVVQDGRFITGNGPDAAEKFGKAVVAALS